MENKDLNEKVLNRLKEKIATEEYRKENRIYKKKKSNIFFKVASFIIVAGIIAGNFYTYAVFKQDIFSLVLDKMGVLDVNKENIVQIEEIVESNKTTMTLQNYVIIGNDLLVTYKLKFNSEIDLGINHIFDITNLFIEDDIYNLERSNSSSLYKISDTEFEIFKLYNLGGLDLKDNTYLETYLYLPRYWDGNENIGEWNFKLNLKDSKRLEDYNEYNVENGNGILENLDKTNRFNYGYDMHDFRVAEVYDSEMITKLVIVLENYLTGGETYSVEVLDEDGNVILEEGVQFLFGGIPTEILLRKLDLNSKITINVYEKDLDNVIACGGVTIDLSKDLKPKEIKDTSYTTKRWGDLKFKYDKEMNVENWNNSNSLSFLLYQFVGGIKDELSMGIINVSYDKDTYNKTLQEIFEEQKSIWYISYSSPLFNDKYTLWTNDGKEVELTHSQMLELAKNKEININGQIINKDNFEFNAEYENDKEITIKGIDAITWTFTGSREYMFIYKGNMYQISVPNDIKSINIVKDFIDNIEFL